MIEILLQAERTLAAGRLDEAERLYRQAADADPRNSIAVVGLARVALERDDDPGAYRLARRALEIDPENVAAQRLAQRLEEVYDYRGESIAGIAGVGSGGPAASPAAGSGSLPAVEPVEPVEPTAPALPAVGSASPRLDSTPPAQPSLIDRLLRRSRP